MEDIQPILTILWARNTTHNLKLEVMQVLLLNALLDLLYVIEQKKIIPLNYQLLI